MIPKRPQMPLVPLWNAREICCRAAALPAILGG